MSADILTWNDFQRRYKGRWSQKELSARFSEHKATGAMPATDQNVSEKKTARTGRSKHAQQLSAGAGPEGLDTPGQTLTWNHFQVR